MTTKIASTETSELAPEPRGRLSRWASFVGPTLGVGFLFGVLTLVMTWPVIKGLRHHFITWGDPVFQAWTMAWDVHAWLTDPLHVFQANIFYPYRNTLAYSDHLFGQAALMFPVLLFSGTQILADNLSTFIALAASALAMYLMVRDLGCSRPAAFVAGIAYAFAPARLAHIEHLHLLSAQWLPLAVLCCRRALRGKRRRWGWAIGAGACVLLQGLFGVYFFYFMAILLAIVLVTYLIGNRNRTALINTGKIVVCCVAAVAILLPTLIPYQQVHDDLGAERGLGEVQKWSARASDYLAVSPRNRLWGPTLAPEFNRDLERDLFPGAALILLAVAGLFYRRLGWERWVLFAITALSILLSFGPYWELWGMKIPGIYQIPYDLLPGFKAIRVPARLGLLALVGMAGLAGLGVELILSGLRRLNRQHLFELGSGLAVVVVLGGGIIAEDMTRIVEPGPLPTTLAEANRPDYAWMKAHPQPTIEFPMGTGLISSAWPNYWSIMHWNPVVNGYSGIAPPAYYVFRDAMLKFPDAHTIQLLQGIGVRTVVYHANPAVPAAKDPVLVGIQRYRQLQQVVGRPNYVYVLTSDPWMWQLVAAVPGGQSIDLPAMMQDPASFGMLAAIFQRQGHTVYGKGTLQYWHLPAAPSSICYEVLPAGQSPGGSRFAGASSVGTWGYLTLYRASSCRAAK